MNTESHLQGLAMHCVHEAKAILEKKSLAGSLTIYAVCLYGGGAQYQYGKKSSYKDYDVHIFLDRSHSYKAYESSKLNRHGGVWGAGIYKGKPVELFFGIIDSTENSIQENISKHIKNHFSDRWNGIKKNPILILWPERYDYEFIER